MRQLMLAVALASSSLTVASAQPPIAKPDARGLPRRDILNRGQTLSPGQWLKTSNGSGDLYGVVLQEDGNFVLYDNVDKGRAIWSSWDEWPNTNKNPIKKIVF